MLLNPKIKPIQSQKVLDFLNRLNHLEDYLSLDSIEWVLDGPTETVKTWTSCLFVFLACLKFPNLRVVILRREKTTVYTTILQTLVQHILPEGLRKTKNNIVSAYGGDKRPDQLNFKNGSTIIFSGEDDREGKVLGSEWDIALYSQCEQSDKSFWEKLSGRCTGRMGNLRANGEPIGILLGECNPDHNYHHLKERERADLLEMISFEHVDNPMIYYDEEYTVYGQRTISGLKKRYTGYNYERLYLGNWVAAEGLVYSNFNEEAHMKDITWDTIKNTFADTNYHIITGRDYGTTVNSPFCHLAFAYSDKRDTILELPQSQIYHSGKEVSEIGEWIKQIEATIYERLGKKVSYRIADHDSQQQLILQNLGLPAEKAQKEILVGVEEVKARLTGLTILFAKNSLWHLPDPELIGKPQQLFEEWFLYRHKDEQAQLSNLDKADIPIKGSDHALDVVRYICMKLAPKAYTIKSIKGRKSVKAKGSLPAYLR